MPKPRRSGGRGSSRSSSSQISPAVGCNSPASRLSAVDFPQPEGPRKVTNSPPCTSSAKSSSTFFAPKCLLSLKRRRSIIGLEFLDALRADLLVPSVHGRDQILHRQLRHDLELLVHVGVLGPPVLLHELLDVRRGSVERGGFDRRADEGLPRERLLLRAPHELHEVEDDLLLAGGHTFRDRPVVTVDDERRVRQDEDLRIGRNRAFSARLHVPLHDAGDHPARAFGELLERDGRAGRVVLDRLADVFEKRPGLVPAAGGIRRLLVAEDERQAAEDRTAGTGVRRTRVHEFPRIGLDPRLELVGALGRRLHLRRVVDEHGAAVGHDRRQQIALALALKHFARVGQLVLRKEPVVLGEQLHQLPVFGEDRARILADKPIRLGFVGAGRNTRERHIPGFQKQPGVEFVTVANRSRESGERVAKEFGIRRVEADWRAVVSAPDVDAICIGTWPYTHCEMTIAALAAGKHVLCEARMAMNAAEGRRMLEASRKASQLAAQLVPSPPTLEIDATLKALLADGYVGEVLAVELAATRQPSFVDRDAPLHWRQDVTRSGHNILNMGIWYEAMIRWLGPARRVSAMAKVAVPRRRDERGELRDVKVPDHVDILATLAGDAVAHMRFSAVTALSPGNEVWIFGADGTLRLEADAKRLSGARRGERELREIPIPAERRVGWRVEEEFVNAVRGREKVSHTTFEDGVRYMEFTDAVAQSLALGRAVEVADL